MTVTSRRRDAERTTNDLLAAAEHEFAEHGYARARVDRIAARAGVTKGLIFQRFGDKAGLYRAMFDAVNERWKPTDDELRGLLRADTREEFVATIERLVQLSIEFLVAEPHAARVVLWEIASGWATLCDHDPAEAMTEPIRDFLARADRSGFLRADLPSEAQLGLVTQVPMVMSAMRMDISAPGMRAFITDFIVAGLVVPA
ncbi:hypothetical protein GCM10027418_26620 [Mariniluteicoccus endophyticus]